MLKIPQIRMFGLGILNFNHRYEIGVRSIMATFLLLHDAFQDSGVWKQIYLELRDKGHEVHTPSYMDSMEGYTSGTGESLISNAVDKLKRYICDVGLSDAVLVCVGFSGMLGPYIASAFPSAIGHLVFWDAVVPEIGKSYIELCPADFAENLRAYSGEVMVAPVKLGSLPRLESFDHLPPKLFPVPLSVFMESYEGPSKEEWPKVTMLHTSSSDAFDIAITSKQSKQYNADWIELDLDEYPVMGKAQEVAGAIASVVPNLMETAQGGCGRRTMPHELRMQYCSLYRKRQELAELSLHRIDIPECVAGMMN